MGCHPRSLQAARHETCFATSVVSESRGFIPGICVRPYPQTPRPGCVPTVYDLRKSNPNASTFLQLANLTGVKAATAFRRFLWGVQGADAPPDASSSRMALRQCHQPALNLTSPLNLNNVEQLHVRSTTSWQHSVHHLHLAPWWICATCTCVSLLSTRMHLICQTRVICD